ncbi:protein PIN-LIKES 7-like [Punica granatum]|uniref:Protein PIN-LIKES 7-like n=2 Tax=Punica granatum TaxID=22663 RepID=A0A6P8EAA2_PUNGR|nr:protein PIN-LIKES 7-like [Punica granatum]XP_031402241.1 protein PIN-LIKES 7-like [Punica granatum]OWM68335.1 hypothetical protein CDL15_Pgr004817 [Punica granatum]PKI57046.1 hypothetical protein CRG98_022550 [Punica granatum]
MGFWTLFEVASMPILEVLLISVLGAFMATGYCNLLNADARKSLNKIVFVVFTPSLMFASLAKTVTLQDIISWWFMPINIGITFLVGGILGWIVAKLLKPKPYLEGLVIATCSAGNLGNLMLIIVPAICKEKGSPFGNKEVCSTVGLSYASFSMALGGFYIWTYTYHLIRTSSLKYQALKASDENEEVPKSPNLDYNANGQTRLLEGGDQGIAVSVESSKTLDEVEDQPIVSKQPGSSKEKDVASWTKLKEFLHKILEELLAPPTIAAILGFIFGAVTWLRNLIIGDSAPLRVIQDSVKLLGDGTIPCITLILGGNLTQGLKTSKIKPWVTVGVICVRYFIQPLIGIGIVKAAASLGFLPSNKLFHYVLMVQYTVPPAMNIGTMTQLFDVGQEECSVLFFWTYLVAGIALTVWSTVYMWILS